MTCLSCLYTSLGLSSIIAEETGSPVVTNTVRASLVICIRTELGTHRNEPPGHVSEMVAASLAFHEPAQTHRLAVSTQSIGVQSQTIGPFALLRALSLFQLCDRVCGSRFVQTRCAVRILDARPVMRCYKIGCKSL